MSKGEAWRCQSVISFNVERKEVVKSFQNQIKQQERKKKIQFQFCWLIKHQLLPPQKNPKLRIRIKTTKALIKLY